VPDLRDQDAAGRQLLRLRGLRVDQRLQLGEVRGGGEAGWPRRPRSATCRPTARRRSRLMQSLSGSGPWPAQRPRQRIGSARYVRAEQEARVARGGTRCVMLLPLVA
jgi:hypothetical protein